MASLDPSLIPRPDEATDIDSSLAKMDNHIEDLQRFLSDSRRTPYPLPRPNSSSSSFAAPAVRSSNNLNEQSNEVGKSTAVFSPGFFSGTSSSTSGVSTGMGMGMGMGMSTVIDSGGTGTGAGILRQRAPKVNVTAPLTSANVSTSVISRSSGQYHRPAYAPQAYDPNQYVNTSTGTGIEKITSSKRTILITWVLVIVIPLFLVLYYNFFNILQLDHPAVSMGTYIPPSHISSAHIYNVTHDRHNDHLKQADRILEGLVYSPEALLLDRFNVLHVTSPKGAIMKMVGVKAIIPFVDIHIKDGNGLSWPSSATLATIKSEHKKKDENGRIISIGEISKDTIFVADVEQGLVKIELDNHAVTLAANKTRDNKPVMFCNGVAFAKITSRVYFTDSTDIVPWSINKAIRENGEAVGGNGAAANEMISKHVIDTEGVFERDGLRGIPSGRLIMYDPHLQYSKEIIKGLWFPTGVAVAPDESYVLVAETHRQRINKFHLTGSKKGKLEIFSSDIFPGYIHGISFSLDGKYVYSTIHRPFPRYLRVLSYMPDSFWGIPIQLNKCFRNLLMLFPSLMTAGAREEKLGGIIVLNAHDGSLVEEWYDITGELMQDITSVTEAMDGKLYIGSSTNDFIGVFHRNMIKH